MQRPALVLDGHLKQSLAIVRSLGERGILIWCGATRGSAMACHSRYVTERFTYPDPKEGQEEFLAALRAVALVAGKPVVYASSDATIVTLFEHRESLRDSLELVFPEPASFELAFDKGATYSEARVHGVPAVKTYIRERKEEVEQLADELSFPAVVKTRHSIVFREGKGYAGTANFVMNRDELLTVFRGLYEKSGEAPLLQPFMKGEEYGVELLTKDGHVHAEAIHHRLRSMSPTGGASVLKETVEDSELSEKLRQHAYTLVQALSWTGPVMVEFKIDQDTREPKLMELNGRWWGSLPLAVAAGVDFPHLYYQLATGVVLPEEPSRALPGVTTRHFLGDLRHLLRVWFVRDPMRKVLYPGRMKALKDFFRRVPGTGSDVWNWKDPLPAFVEYIDVITRLVT